MSREHHLKCWPEPFWAIWKGEKHHEFRKDDRGFQLGDVLHLLLCDPETGELAGKDCRRRVTYISRGSDWGIPEGYVVMSVKLEAVGPPARPLHKAAP